MTFKPMLAVNIAPEDVRFPVYASAKLDGVRGVVIDGKLHSRSLKAIPNACVSKMFSRHELSGLDGELIAGPPTATDAFRATQSACSRQDGTPKVTFYVFDNFLVQGGFGARLGHLKAMVSVDLPAGVEILEQRLVRSVAELLAFEAKMLSLGYEGLILRDPDGAYKFGRSTAREGGMLKVKRFQDSEAKILEVIEEMENTNAKKTNELGKSQRSHHQAGMVGKGRAGALRVRDLSTGVEFNVGTGMNDQDREWFWTMQPVGKVIKYKSFLIGKKDAPRFPVFLGLRDAWDRS